MKLQELTGWIREVNEANGFAAPDWDTLLTKLMLVVTELNEARDGVQGSGADPLPEELADTAIRLLDILGAIWPDDWSVRLRDTTVEQMVRGNILFAPIETVLWRPLQYICMAAEAWRYDNQIDTRIAIEIALAETMAIASALDINMIEEISRKVRRNAERGYLHGKARTGG